MNLLLDSRSDASLVRQALAGRARSLEALVLRYQRKAYALARAVSLDPDAADDIVQEAFLLALQNLTSLRSHASFGPWFLQIVRNVARKRFRREPLEFSADAEPSVVAELDSAEVAETRDRIWSEVRRLPPTLREAVFLYYHEGRSVREVARALGISSAAARKRLQTGREQLSERLWRRLESTLRDLLPSARGWKAQGRRIALVAIASLPAGRTLEASVGSAGGLALTGGSPVSAAFSALGVFIMANKALFSSVLLIAALSGGAWLWSNRTDESPASDSIASAPGGALDERSPADSALVGRLARSEAELQRLRRENRRLSASLDRAEQADRSARVEDQAEPRVEASASGIDWSDLSRLIAENIELIGKIRRDEAEPEFSAAEQAQLMQIMTAFMTINASARERSDRPFFDSVIFDELTLALFERSLGLTEAQAAEISRINRAAIEAALGEADPAALPPLERYRLRRAVAGEVRGAFDELLDDEQHGTWESMQDFANAVFEGPLHTFEYGLGSQRLPRKVAELWQETFHLEEYQLEPAKKVAAAYVEAARDTVSRYGADDQALRALSADDRERLDGDLAELQSRYEREIVIMLDESQVEAYLRSDPSVVRFRHGNGTSSSHKSGLF